MVPGPRKSVLSEIAEWRPKSLTPVPPPDLTPDELEAMSQRIYQLELEDRRSR